jgi:L-2-hydroxycarboxylate dehydrogenase (NAD+)
MADAGMTRVPARAVTSLLTDSFVAAGLPAADAARCAELMTEADLTGAEGHGILRLPQYVRRLKARGFNAHPNITGRSRRRRRRWSTATTAWGISL